MTSGPYFLLLLSLFVAVVAEVKWKRSSYVMNWSYGCDFSGQNSWSSSSYKFPNKITSRACLNMCFQDHRCSHSVWTPNGYCYLKTMNTTDVGLKCAPEEYVCGIKALAEANKTESSECKTADATKMKLKWESMDFDMYWNHGCDFPGHDVDIRQISSDACKNDCYRLPGCTHFTWTPGDHFCYLKSINTSNVQPMCAPEKFICGIKGAAEIKKPVYSECNTTAVTQINKTIGGYRLDMYSGCDFSGNNIERSINRENTLVGCDRKCAHSPRCTHITWTPYGDCIMKMNATTDMQPTCRPAGYLCGIKVEDSYERVIAERDLKCNTTAINPVMTWKNENYDMHTLNGCDFPGYDYWPANRFAVLSLQECLDKCVADEWCTHFTWTGEVPGGCSWKSFTNSYPVQPKCAPINYMCGFKRSASRFVEPPNCP